MKKNAQRILSGILAVLILSVSAFPAYAVSIGSPLYDTIDFYTYVYGIYKGWREGHPDTDYSQYSGFRGGGFGSDPDRVGGGSFSKDESKTAYDDYVQTLPAQGYTSAGRLTWQPTVSDLDLSRCEYYQPRSKSRYSSDLSVLPFEQGTICIIPLASGNGLSYSYSTSSGVLNLYSGFDFYFQAPISGSFGLIESPRYSSRWVIDGGSVIQTSGSYSSSSFLHCSAGEILECSRLYVDGPSNYRILSFFFEHYFPFYEVIPDSSLSETTYSTTTRPTSISGGALGIADMDASGQLTGSYTKVEDNSSIVNETNNTYYNPATGVTAPITNWSYDYSDRSYKVNLEGGKTSSVTYGDENITIVETTVNESGDTITNNYTIYYLGDGSGSENPPSTCEHTWAETSSTAPTCTVPGSKLSTCSKCQQTKKEAVPALGHDWQVKQSVTTEYDETGQLTQQGYIIFECSRCHEQYKSTDGTIPPGGGSGTDPGEEDDTTIGGLIEKLLSGVGSIVGGIIKGLLSLLTKAVEALAGLAELFTTFVSSLVDLWGGFTSFLSAVFPFLPEEFIIIIELGLILVIAAAVFRKFIS